MAKRKTPRPAAAAAAIERKLTKPRKTGEQYWYWSFPLIEIVFMVDGQVQVLKRQIFNKSPEVQMSAGQLHLLNNTAALQVFESLPDGVNKDSYQVLNAFLISLNPLGRMTEKQFWGKFHPATSDASQPSPVTPPAVATDATIGSDNVVPFTGGPTAE